MGISDSRRFCPQSGVRRAAVPDGHLCNAHPSVARIYRGQKAQTNQLQVGLL